MSPSSEPPKRRRPVRAREVAFAAAVAILVLGAIEAAFRLAPARREKYEEFYDDIYDLSYAMVPGAINPYSPIRESLNTFGFRGANYPEAKPPGAFRVVCLGDSCTFGFKVAPEESYPAKLEQGLRAAHPGLRIEVINGGVPGTDFYQHLLVLKKKLLRFGPDLLVDWSHPNWTWSIKRFRDRAERPPFYAFLQRPLRRLATYRRLQRWLKEGPTRAALYENLWSHEAGKEDVDEVYLQDYVRDLDDLRALSAEHGFALLFTNYPSRRSVLDPSVRPPWYDRRYHATLGRTAATTASRWSTWSPPSGAWRRRTSSWTRDIPPPGGTP